MTFYTLPKHRHVLSTCYQHLIASNICNYTSSIISFKCKNHILHANSFSSNDGIHDSIPTFISFWHQSHSKFMCRFDHGRKSTFICMNYITQIIEIFLILQRFWGFITLSKTSFHITCINNFIFTSINFYKSLEITFKLDEQRRN